MRYLLLLFVCPIFPSVIQGFDIPKCPNGLRQIIQDEKTAKVYTCAKKIGACLDNDALEMVTEKEAGIDTCFLAEGPKFYKNTDGSALFMNYAHGILHGSVYTFDSKGTKLLDENYLNGIKTGKRTLYYPNGNRKIEENYTAGLRRGESRLWYESGQPHKKMVYKEGKREGKTEEWFPNGAKKSISHLTGGVWQGLFKEWYSTKSLYSDMNFKDGLLDGKNTLYHRNGNQMSSRTYKLGKLEGELTEWDEYGQIEATSFYRNGNFVEFKYQSAKSLEEQNSNKQIRKSMILSSCAAMAGMGFSSESLGGGPGCMKGDFDGNGHLDNIFTVEGEPKQSRVVLIKRNVILKEFLISDIGLDIYSARSLEGQFDEPATPRDGLVAWGKGTDTHVYLYDYDTEQFVKSVHASDF